MSEALYPFDNTVDEARFQSLTHQTKCMVCQNQSIAESSTDFSVDLKQWMVEAIQAGQTDSEIKQHLVARFGDEIFYAPPMQLNTIFLWILPLLLIVSAAVVLRRVLK